MGQGVNGHVTVNVGVANGNGRKVPSAPHRLGEEERNARARRLRKDGWSYRRISASLGMSYAAVCRLLDGDEARIPLSEPIPMPRRAPAPAAAVALDPAPAAAPAASVSARLDKMAGEVRVLQQRLDVVLAISEGHRQHLARLERSMVTTLQSEHRALGQRLHTTVKSLLERMLPAGFRPRGEPTDWEDGGDAG